LINWGISSSLVRRKKRPAGVTRLVFCSGRLYFDLLKERRRLGRRDIAIVRIEQLYPFPKEHFDRALEAYDTTEEIIWCQEEPQNQGAWDQIKHRFHNLMQEGKRPYYVGRPSSAAPAVGHRAAHVEQQERLIDEALTGHLNPSMNKRIPPQ
jgi:2-oxoglutarate dehydrogenase E1 component